MIKFAMVGFLGLVAAGSGGVLAGPAHNVPVEEVIESSAHDVRLPSAAGGALTFSNCGSCNARPLRLTSSTVYNIGQKSVSLTALTEFLAANDSAFLMVYYKAGTTEITRVVAPGNPAR
jgi:hypothetical protein